MPYYDKANLAVEAAASRDATRAQINCILFEEGRSVATDGKLLAIADASTVDPDRYPLSGKLPDPSYHKDRPVHRKYFQDLKRATSGDGLLSLVDDGEKVEFHGDRLAAKPAVEEAVDYPDYQKCFPGSAPEFKISIDADVLQKIGKIAKDASCHQLTFKVHENPKGSSHYPCLVVASGTFQEKYDLQPRNLTFLFTAGGAK